MYRLYDLLCDLVLHVINLKDTILTYSIANILFVITQLYRIMFKQVVDKNSEISVYINSFKSVTSRMTSKPLLFKHYMVNISLYRSVLISFMTLYVRYVE